LALLGRVVCPYCKRLTLKGKYCMNCGKELPPELQEVPPTAAPAQPTRVAEAKPQPQPTETVAQPAQPAQPTAPPTTVGEMIPEEVAEERKLIEQLSKLYSWSLRLIDLLLDGEATTDVFTEIYDEYSSRIATLDEKRRDMITKYEERLRELNERSENLKIRHEIGEIGDRDYIRQKIDIDKEISKIRPKLAILQNPIEIRLADIPSFTQSVEKKIKDINEKGTQLGLSSQQVSKITSDLQSLLDASRTLIEQHNKIKHEIQKIEIRYKIGELKQDEYLAQKQRLERQLELTF
jgi:chromosome segregation ATPase